MNPIVTAARALLHQIEIGDFTDSLGHSAKMLKAAHDLNVAIAAPVVPEPALVASDVAKLVEALQALIPMFEAWHEEFPDDVGHKEGPALAFAREALATFPQAAPSGWREVFADARKGLNVTKTAPIPPDWCCGAPTCECREPPCAIKYQSTILMSAGLKDDASCRGCGRVLIGRNYCFGGRAYVPRADGCHGIEAKVNYYGGFVCSRSCDYRSSLELEESMPGHAGQRSLSPNSPAMRHIELNWDRP